MRLAVRWLLAALLVGGLAQTSAAGTLAEVKDRGKLRCGVNGLVPGLSFKDENGRWSGLDVDFCRAVAAAALGDGSKVEFLPLSTDERLDALSGDHIDLLARNTTWTLSRDLGHGMSFVGILYLDGQGFLVAREAGLYSTLELDGKRICSLANSTSPANAQRYFTRNRMKLELETFQTFDAAKQAYLDGKCDALTGDQSQLHSLRAGLKDPRVHEILPEVISKEPLSPAVRKGDDQWFDIVRWTLFVLIDAEELGIDSTNVDRAREQAREGETRLLLDADGHTGKLLELEPGWSHRVIKQVGNYAEVFERNLGSQSPLKIKRGLNALWRDGGLLYAPPAR
ncbi:MAG: amino acid ABC transporter substrate-binding protein [Pseudomonadota bacterium]|nr:amino acid ABC transporter substrate-binding protein [Pseudomonadota bacterium]